jgi:bacterioferritin (cytochrome b1)
MHKLGESNLGKVIDILTERLEYERAGVRLYDSIIVKMQASGDPQIAKMLDQMMEHRDQEKEHEEWLEAKIRALGGDAHTKTEMAMLVARESKGIEEVIHDGDPDIAHLFHALLAAELVDNAGWDLLTKLADEAGDRELKKEFKKRLHEEEEHLLFVRKVVERFARRDVLGESISMPSAL